MDGLNIVSLEDRLKAARDRGVDWLLARIASDGTPADAHVRAGWGRVPWALALSGQTAAAAAVIGWAERTSLAADGGFQPGPALGAGIMTAYPLSHLAIGAWLAERYDIALMIMSKVRSLQNADTGGLTTSLPGPGGAAMDDLLVTAQAGMAALVTGQDDIIDGVLRWINELYAMQPDLPNRLYSMREGAALVTDLPANARWLGLVDFRLPRQTFYHPGMAAAFLAGVSLRRGDSKSSALAAEFLQLNIGGTDAQFNDLEAVQICKFGWGASTMLLAAPTGGYLPHVKRMAEWFMKVQDDDGGWSPSRYISPAPDTVERMTKTSEHVMEVTTILAALGTARGRDANGQTK